ncbi:putative baseplate assembly protein [Kitasatospora sp. NPDC059327]|uniref:putative baseplate assembly protein n=1 Tax=Kitasatospora sp. NPDC059327 TaxID=3346803 RepID=UPI00369CB7EC
MTRGDDRRRARVRAAGLSGIDGVDVREGGRGDHLVVTLLGEAPPGLTAANFRVDGGQRITGIAVLEVRRHTDGEGRSRHRLLLRVDRPGDLSVYRLSVVRTDPHGRPGTEPHPGFDRCYASTEFTFRPESVGPDCAEERAEDGAEPGIGAVPHLGAAPGIDAVPDIDYLAKDYDSFRRLMLDRLALTVPGWTERHVPDLGITLVELLAAEGDRLSYHQDAVATEAYLDTARRRVSVRRHARLVDYRMHDGCAARAWVCLETDQDLTLPAGDFRFATRVDGAPPGAGAAVPAADLDRRDLPPYEVFEPVHTEDVALYRAHSLIHLWTWGDADHCLPVGTTSAALVDSAPQDPRRERILRLRPGDVLVFEEVLGATTGVAADADRTRRQAVRLLSVAQDVDRLYDQPILRVGWAPEDALAFSLRVGGRGGPDCADLDIGVARGNTVLVEHGRSIDWCHRPPETIDVPVVPPAEPGCPPPERWGCPDEDRAATRPPYPPLPVRFAPALRQTPVTRTAPFPPPAAVATAQARLLLGLPDRARHRLTEIWHRLTPEHGQLPPADRAYLVTLFGESALRRAGLDHRPGPALRTLLGRFDDLLAAKLARWAELLRRARAGTVLRFDAEGWELGQSWGEEEREGLRESAPALRGPAAAALTRDPRHALPAVRLTDQDGHDWRPRRDLLDSGPADRDLVGESDDDGVLRLRFGDGRNGAAFPLADGPGRQCAVRYRVGNGTAGNVGAEVISRIVFRSTRQDGIRVVRNPLPAGGGVDPEPVEDVRRLAPVEPAGRLLRAVTAQDYATLAARTPGVRRAAAALRWTGSWYEARVAVEAFGTATAPDHLLDAVRDALFRYRRVGHDLAVSAATLVPLDLALRVRVDPGAVAGQVGAALRTVFAALFAPDAMDFGEPVRASRLVAAAVAVPGVRYAEVTRLARLFAGPADPGDALATGLLPIGPFEAARLDDDPSRPENGRLALDLEGGR